MYHSVANINISRRNPSTKPIRPPTKGQRWKQSQPVLTSHQSTTKIFFSVSKHHLLSLLIGLLYIESQDRPPCRHLPPTAMESHGEKDGVTELIAESSSDSTELPLLLPPFPSLDGVEKIIEYTFKNKKLLEEAYTHGSFQKEKKFSYERLEYMGDSVLSLLITKEQFFSYPDLQPGPLTRLRSANVDKEKLARVALTRGLHRFLRHNKPNIQQQVFFLPWPLFIYYINCSYQN